MATYSGGETIVNIVKVTGAYTVPAGRYAEAYVSSVSLAASSSFSVFGQSVGTGGGGSFSFPLANELETSLKYVGVSGESISFTGGATFVVTVKEFNNP